MLRGGKLFYMDHCPASCRQRVETGFQWLANQGTDLMPGDAFYHHGLMLVTLGPPKGARRALRSSFGLADGERVVVFAIFEGVCYYCKRAARLQCARCQTTYYCSAACQRADWANHARHAHAPDSVSASPVAVCSAWSAFRLPSQTELGAVD